MATWSALLFAPLALLGWFALALVAFDGRPRRARAAYRRSRIGRRIRLARIELRMRLGRRASDRRMLERLRRGDAEMNERSKPPPGERLDWVALWMVEVYAPSHVPKLTQGLKDLGWDERRADFDDVVSWLREARGSGRAQSFSLGPYTRVADSTGFPRRRVPLASCFDSVVPSFVQLPAGVTVAIAEFILAPEAQGRLDVALREDTTASLERLKGTARRTLSAEGAKSRRLAAVRGEVRSEAAAWMARLAPGAVAEAGGEIPSWDLIVSEGSELWSGQRERGWLDTAGYGLLERWRSEEVVTSLCMPRYSNGAGAVPAFTATAAEVSGVWRARAGAGEDPNHIYFATELADEVALPIALLGLREATRGYGHRFAALRDLRIGRHLALVGARRQLRRLQEEGLPMASDAEGLRRSASHLTEEGRGIVGLLGGGGFRYVPEGPHENVGPEETLEAQLSAVIEEEAAAGAETGESAVGSLRALGEILVARTNLQLQVVVVILTVAVLALSYLTLRSSGGDGSDGGHASAGLTGTKAGGGARPRENTAR